MQDCIHRSDVLNSIPSSRNPNTLEGLKSRLSVGIHRIPAELSHSTELELGKLHCSERIPAELPHSTYSEDSRQAEKSFGPQNLASLSLSTLQE
jgi:hypothetical protein